MTLSRTHQIPFDFPLVTRLDLYIAQSLCLLTRSQIKARKLTALVNGAAVKLSRPVKAGDVLVLSWLPEAPEYLIRENIPLRIIYEDQNCVVINKAQGMVVHPGAGNKSGTLANALAYRRNPAEYDMTDHGDARTGIVHRLDKDTSGVIIAACNDAALRFLSAQFKSRKVKKRYIALVKGVPPQTGTISGLMRRESANRKRFSLQQNRLPNERGKMSLTFYRVLKTWNGYSLLLLKPKTGRTHQLRVHLKSIGCPILCDPLYGKPDKQFPGGTLMLHAYSLSVTLPGADRESRFTAPLPLRFKRVIDKLGPVPERD
ncbi:MAG: RluA family pseudouridine synthase [Treponema sp.]|jgi:23S rRNA pseudouridine1911/1915/1917 synthase|nr:RluA family pseudouridine synthase [Treponema sp.]